MVVTPTKFSVGMKVTFVPLMLAVPFVGLTEIMLKVPPGVRTTSFVSGENVFVESSAMLNASGFASGGMFVTVTVMMDEFVPPTLSVIV